jgi:hypothetical protein
MFYVENYVGCTLAIGNVKQACTVGRVVPTSYKNVAGVRYLNLKKLKLK